MTTEERRDLYHAIDEFWDDALHSSIKPEISDKAKVIALKCMIMIWNENSKIKIGGNF